MFVGVLIGSVVFGLAFIALVGIAIRGHQLREQRVDQQLRYQQAHKRYQNFLQTHRHVKAPVHKQPAHVIPPALDIEVQIHQDGTVNELASSEVPRAVRF